MTEHDVVIAGAGPTGLMLAAELALARVDVVIVERRPDQTLAGSRAGGLHARTLEVLEQRGVAGRFLAEGRIAQVAGFAMIPLDVSDFPTRHPYGLALGQARIEHLLAAWVAELGVPIVREREVTGFAEDDAGIDVALSDGRSLRARYLVGCDGGRSLVRRAAGIDLAGWEASTSYLIAEVETTDEPPWGIRRDARGIHGWSRMEDGRRARVVSTEPRVVGGGEPTVDELRQALVAVYGTDHGLREVTWISRFTDAARQATAYRKGRVLLAGDAAHVHSPAGGQGLNLGVQDAVNLGWKLARVVEGAAAESLLDTYQAERHPVAARVLQLTMAQTALAPGDARTSALRDVMTDLLQLDAPRKRYAGIQSGLELQYDLGPGHPLRGRRMPDHDVVTAAGPTRVSTLLHEARPILLDLADAGLDLGPWADRVTRVEGRITGAWELPVLGTVPAPSAVLVRPDGYVAWVGEGTSDGLGTALATWFGPAHRGRDHAAHGDDRAWKDRPMSHRLFVYGTLAPGRSNAHVLADLAGTWEAATIHGTLFPDGWGAAAGYPGVVLDEAGAEVTGFLFTSVELPDHWERIDAFEGDGYERVTVPARRTDGTTVQAFVYALRPRPGRG